MTTASRALARLQQQSAVRRRLLTIVLIVLAGLLVMERFSALTVAIASAGWTGAMAQRLAAAVVAACPEVFYLAALWGMRQALDAIARGELFATTVVVALRRVGWMLALGAAIGVFVVPGVQSLLGAGPGYLVAYDIGGLVLGALGVSLAVFAGALAHARALQTELDEMF